MNESTQISSIEDLNELHTAEEENLGDIHQNNPVFKEIKANALRERVKNHYNLKVFFTGVAMLIVGIIIGIQQ